MADTNPIEAVYDTAAQDWLIENVTVFDSSAEIVRKLDFHPEVPGVYAIRLDGLPQKIRSNSLRAEVNSKAATILEVSFGTRGASQEQTETDHKIKGLNEEVAVLDRALARIQVNNQWLNRYAQAVLPMGTRAVDDTQVVTQALLEPHTLELVANFTEFLSDQEGEFESKTRELRARRNELTAQIAKVCCLKPSEVLLKVFLDRRRRKKRKKRGSMLEV